MAKRANAFGNDVDRISLLGVLVHEHLMQAVELRAGDVPVEVVCHEIQRVTIGEQRGKSLRDLLPLVRADSDVDRRGLGFCGVYGRFSLVNIL